MAYNNQEELLLEIETPKAKDPLIHVKKVLPSNPGVAPKIDIRAMYIDDSGITKHTSRGVRFSIEEVPALIEALTKAME